MAHAADEQHLVEKRLGAREREARPGDQVGGSLLQLPQRLRQRFEYAPDRLVARAFHVLLQRTNIGALGTRGAG